MPTIYFDMDGTLSDLFNVPKWQEKLAARDCSPYHMARPLCRPESLKMRLARYHADGYNLGIITWCSIGADAEFEDEVRVAKTEWLKKHDIWKCFDIVHILPYGTPKYLFLEHGDILVDDDLGILEQWRKWGGIGVEAKDFFAAEWN